MTVKEPYRTLKLPCYYVPSIESRIASIKCVLESYLNDQIMITNNKLSLISKDGN